MYIENMQQMDEQNMMNNRKTYYSIREVCGQTGLEPHVLRYWESEFPQLRPKKNRAGNRAYRDKDIEIIAQIKQLLYEEQFTIPGAKKKLSEVRLHKEEEAAPVAEQPEKAAVSTMVEELKDIHALLVS